MTLHNTIRQQLLGNLTQPQPDEAAQLNNALRLLAKWRSVLIQNTLLQHQGTVVMEGPLKGMADRVTVGALFKPEDFAAYAGQKVLVLCDIEGAERELLDPTQTPTLAGMDLIVESHECLVPGITQLLIERFAPTHDITRVQDNGQRQLRNAPAWFNNLAHLDQLLAVWEWRSGPRPTPPVAPS